MLININTFTGMIPKLAPRLLPDTAAQTATNIKMVSGNLKPWLIPLSVATPSKGGTKTSIYKVHSDGTDYWLHWVNYDVNVCESPIANDDFVRIYWTGDGVPKMAPLSVAISGGTGYPVASYALGIPAPESSPTITVVTPTAYSAMATYAINDLCTYETKIYQCITTISVAEAWTAAHWQSPDPILIESRAYVVTYVSAYGEEGPPCNPTIPKDVVAGQQVDITDMPSAPNGNYNVTQKRLYRTNTGTSTTEYQLVATLAVGNDEYNDILANTDLVEVLPSTTWDPPLYDLAGLIVLPNGCFAGFSGKVFCMSVPYMPHAWPTEYQIVVADPIVGLGAYGTSVLITTEGAPYIATGSDPAAMTIERLEEGYACTSKRGIVDMGYSIVYPTPFGLMSAGVGGVGLATKDIFSKADWLALSPSTMDGYHYAGNYFGFSDTASFMFNPQNGTYVTLGTGLVASSPTAGYHDPETGEFYLLIGGVIYQWDAGATAASLTWKSKPFVAPYPVNFGAAQVSADTYTSLTCKFCADGVLKLTQTVANANPFRLPGGFRATVWEIEISGVNVVNQVSLGSTMADLAQT